MEEATEGLTQNKSRCFPYSGKKISTKTQIHKHTNRALCKKTLKTYLRMDVSATSTRMSKLTSSDNKPLLAVDHLEAASNLHSVTAKNREISIAIKEEEEAEEIGESDLGRKEEEGRKTIDVTAKEEKEEEGLARALEDKFGLLTTHLEEGALEGECTEGQPEMDNESNSDKSGLLTTHL